MAKQAQSVIGIDLGKHNFKSVLLQRKGEHRFVLTNFASHPVPDSLQSADDLAREVRLLLKELGGSISALSEPGKGTVITMLIPLIETERPADAFMAGVA